MRPAASFTRWFSNRPAERQAQMAALRDQASAPAIFPALVAPWMDVGCGHAGVSTLIHNNGSEPLVVRRHQVVGTVTPITHWEAGPSLFQRVAWEHQPGEPEAQGPSREAAAPAAFGTGAVGLAGPDVDGPDPHYTLPDGDWRQGKDSKALRAIIRSDPARLAEFQVWHTTWYDKICFGPELTQAQRSCVWY